MYMKEREKEVVVRERSYLETASLALLTILTVLLAVIPSALWGLISPSAEILFKR